MQQPKNSFALFFSSLQLCFLGQHLVVSLRSVLLACKIKLEHVIASSFQAITLPVKIHCLSIHKSIVEDFRVVVGNLFGWLVGMTKSSGQRQVGDAATATTSPHHSTEDVLTTAAFPSIVWQNPLPLKLHVFCPDPMTLPLVADSCFRRITFPYKK